MTTGACVAYAGERRSVHRWTATATHRSKVVVMPEAQPAPAEAVFMGSLIGWRHIATGKGAILRIQAARSKLDLRKDAFDEFDVVLTVQQLRILGYDLIRAADVREGRVPARRRKWWRFGFGR
ncbi:hypothetical protein M9980_01840 [Sphingomonas donggukensis]|uniref:Uncharacterized protein n=1 Tax=Sphingomonas donggukensis TaxID=2949093 RepID=A0ABY4TUN2_9SPHN|nr:hypothetical protein [Sphingomonas donggukensis]URW75997.1 hypothetical protein M9980_01840 [Sphingomonas donggukensis]